MRYFISFCLALCISILALPVNGADFASQRILFLQASEALHEGKRTEFDTLSSNLKTYPLYPYLVYADLSQRLNQNPQQEINNFLQTYNDTPLEPMLRKNWLQQLASQKNWPLFLKYYDQTEDQCLQCLHLQALLATGQRQTAFQIMPKLFMTGSTMPIGCETAFAEWRNSGGLTPDRIWERATLAIDKHNYALINTLILWLPKTQATLLKLWERVAKNPHLVMQTKLFLPVNATTQQILQDGIIRLAQKEPQIAANIWPSLQTAYHFDEDGQQPIIRAIAINFAKNNNPAAQGWLALIKPAYVDQATREWSLRSSLVHSDWKQASYWLQQLLPEEDITNSWRYWQARTLAMTGKTAQAQTIYNNLTKQVDYYGLLASQQLHQPYRPPSSGGSTNPDLINQVNNNPAIQRARELYALQLIPESRREWQWAIEDMDQTHLQAAEELAKQYHWYDRGIITAAKAHDYNNIPVRFPLAYAPEVLASAKQAGIDPAWVFAIMRQESSFITDARSCVGALGLMQLMPHTAKMLANFQVDEYALLDYKTNIHLGTLYLKQMLDWYDGNMIMATAAYNLGPTRLKKWLPLYKTVPTDVWVEVLPWKETRDYVKAVMLNKAIYQQELNKK